MDTPLNALAPTIDIWWTVILNKAKRNEESFTSVATLEGIASLVPRSQ